MADIAPTSNEFGTHCLHFENSIVQKFSFGASLLKVDNCLLMLNENALLHNSKTKSSRE